MKRFLSIAGAVLLALGLSLPAKAYVATENTDAYVVSTCGAQAFPLGVWATVTQLQNGEICVVSSGGGSTTPAVGAAALATNQVSIAATAGGTQIVPQRLGAPGVGRAAVTIINPPGGVTVYIGNTGVTTANGQILPSGWSLTLNTTAAVFGIVATGTQTVGFVETY
jgi:hypothetical protein